MAAEDDFEDGQAFTRPPTGHNLAPDGVAGDQLLQLIERVERLEEERSKLTADIKEVYAELKGHGFDKKVAVAIVRDRKRDREAKAEFDALFDLYARAIADAEGRREDDAGDISEED